MTVSSAQEFLPASTMFVPPGRPTRVVAQSMTSDAALYFHEAACWLPINALQKSFNDPFLRVLIDFEYSDDYYYGNNARRMNPSSTFV